MITVPYEVKKALRDGMLRKNYRFLVLNDDGTTDFTIDNDTLVSESVSIDERMCSGDTLKFGLCEGSSLEFQYFDHPNIYGRRIQAFVDVEYAPGENFYPIPMGFFDVKKCSRQASTGIMKATAYNKLMSEYLDAKANKIVIDALDDPSAPLSMYGIRRMLLGDYEIKPYEETEVVGSVGNTRASTPKISIRFSDLTDGSTPISAVNLHYRAPSVTPSTSRPIYLTFYSDVKAYHVYVNHYYQFRQLNEVMSKFTYWIVEYIKKLIDDSPLNITGQQFIDAINIVWDSGIQYDCYGWTEFCSINNRNQGLSDTFMANDWAYKNGVSTPSYPTTGSISDLSKQLISPSMPQYIRIIIPYEIHLDYWINNNDLAGFRIQLMEDTEFYDGQQLRLYPGMKYEDGTQITLRNLFEKMGIVEILNISQADTVTVNPSTVQDYTLREITSAAYETVCQFGQLSRTTDLFSGVELNNGGLYPAEDLYPADDLYPDGASMSASKAMYSQLWGDEGNNRKWRYLIITYKGLDGDNNEADFTLQRTVNADGTDDYNMSDNWLFRNLVWTAEQVGDYADAMVTKMQNNEWFPFEMWCAGLPYLETGDQIEIPLNGEVYKSYILQRQLKGIQNLQDTYINGTLDIF